MSLFHSYVLLIDVSVPITEFLASCTIYKNNNCCSLNHRKIDLERTIRRLSNLTPYSRQTHFCLNHRVEETLVLL